MAKQLPTFAGRTEKRDGPGTPAVIAAAAGTAGSTGRTVYVETYGCQMNVADSQLVEGIFADAGYSIVSAPDDADVILVNTCSVREHAEERVFGRLGDLERYKHRNPSVVIGVTGCMAERLRGEIPSRSKAVDLVVGPDSYRRLPELIEESSAAPALDVRFDRGENYVGLDPARGDGATGWVTIMRGCNRFCTYCIVPYVRGREKCVPPDEVVRQVGGVVESGCREVCLLGQTVNSYRFEETDFAALLRLVAAVDGIERIRFTSPHPARFSNELVETMAELPNVCPYVHLPVQSGHDAVLERMRRGHTIAEYLDLIESLRSAIPDVAISTDLLVGFCGETDDEFEATRALADSVHFDSAFMFKYSPREGTIAARKLRDDVPEDVKGERLRTIIDLQERIGVERYSAWIGRNVQVLVGDPAKKTPGHVHGRSRGFKSVIVAGEWPRGATSHTLFAVPAERSLSVGTD